MSDWIKVDGKLYYSEDVAALEEKLRVAVELLGEFLDVNDEQCRFDHHGYCQAHFLEEKCLITRTKDLIKIKGDSDEDYDPTPHCTWCGAMSAKNCKCPPRAEND